MADTQTPEGNGAAGAEASPRFRLAIQYIKDLSFENPNAPRSLIASAQTRPNIQVSVNVGAQPLGDDNYEVELKLSASAKHEENTTFLCELSYGGVFMLENFPQEQIQPFLLIEGPRQLFPFARRIIADATRDGGFPPLMLDPIDFVQLFQAEQQRRAQPQ
ncbi:protein-export chaperone SecB [Tistrella mobilis]|jgi:preprotein translocase subunit SecB|uniref:Protein-export protein SecB n=1 Tax=Tistrella mobilis (strain KA081020-065) TaxID=1110502 RepID=I3TR46_TISMK|nr:protein-export chaperone SecB [Tistrella mobilis]AFK55234.1 preprotein translocase subunit SecB [Tistrella mobilis KA081020-065]MAM75121.1 protein-export chaperone SecB [Tistrella sp.]